MRATVCFAFALLSMSGAHASEFSARIIEPVSPATAALAAPDRPLVGLSERTPFTAVRRPDSLPLLGPERPLPGAGASGFSIGPLHADAVTRFSGRSGKAHLVPHYRLEGIMVLG